LKKRDKSQLRAIAFKKIFDRGVLRHHYRNAIKWLLFEFLELDMRCCLAFSLIIKEGEFSRLYQDHEVPHFIKSVQSYQNVMR
jgi:hypothetical protein